MSATCLASLWVAACPSAVPALAVEVPPSPATGAAEAVSQASAAAQRGDYAAAVAGYSTAADLVPACGDLSYDLGTAAAQAGEVGLAVLSLERALRESPWDADARQNLERIRQKRVDKLMAQEPGESPLQRLVIGLPGRLLFWVGLACWWAAFVGYAWRLLGFGRRVRRAWLNAALLTAVTALGLSAAWKAERSARYAVVTGGSTDGVKVHGGPALDLPSSFEVHQGLKLLVLDQENGFTHVRLGNGLEGYLPDQDLQLIEPNRR